MTEAVFYHFLRWAVKTGTCRCEASRDGCFMIDLSYQLKFISTVIITATGRPSFVAGLNFHCLIA